MLYCEQNITVLESSDLLVVNSTNRIFKMKGGKYSQPSNVYKTLIRNGNRKVLACKVF